jgi:cytochrome c-type biogenesis protein CcmE
MSLAKQEAFYLKLGLTALVVLGGLGLLVYSSRAASHPYRMVDKLMDEADAFVGVEMRIHGWVEPGSIVTSIENQQTTRRFILGKSGKRINVTHLGPAPDTFKDESEVVAKGMLHADGKGGYNFQATELMAKCPSKYEGAESQRPNAERPTFQISDTERKPGTP